MCSSDLEAPRREQDAIVLLRRLYEHVVDFAWIAIDPAINAKKWWRTTALIGSRSIGPSETRRARTVRQGERQDAADAGPCRRSRQALVAVDHRPRRVPIEATTCGRIDRERAEREVVAADAVHVRVPPREWERAPYADDPVVLRSAGRRHRQVQIGMNPHDHDDRYAYTFAPLIFATMLERLGALAADRLDE